tara:strand:- start:939 stop:1493 length:555 start_codon:yes stop_codon:yes gene_type:complete
MSKAKYEHLVRNVPNTEKNRKFIKDINKMSKESDSIYKLFIKYRKPKEGFKYGSGGSLKCKNANAFSVYIQDRRPYSKQPLTQTHSRYIEEQDKLHSKIEGLESEIIKLREKLAVYSNPYIDWSITSIQDEIFEIKECIIEKYLDNALYTKDEEVYVDNHYGSISLKEKYNLLMEALEYAEKHD